MARDPAFDPVNARPSPAAAGLKLPPIAGTADALLDHNLQRRLAREGQPPHALGRLEALAIQLARIQNGSPLPFDLLAFDSPQLVVFAADHGIADERMADQPQSMTREHVLQLLGGRAAVNALARQQGFDITVVDAGVATPITLPARARAHAALQPRKIGYGTRNCMLGAAMSLSQAVAAVHAGMDVVRHLPGNVLAVGEIGVANHASAALLLSRLCGVPMADAFPRDDSPGSALDDTLHFQRLDKLLAAAQRHAQSTAPLHALAAFGGFETAMMTGAMLQAASERRVVLVDGFVAGSAALVARSLSPNVADYLVHAQRSPDTAHRLLLIHMQAHPLLDLGLRINQGTGALLAWPLMLAAQGLLES